MNSRLMAQAGILEPPCLDGGDAAFEKAAVERSEAEDACREYDIEREEEPPKRTRSARRAKRKGEANAELGRRGEDAAARFLHRRGYEIVERNWKCAAGEADIIARDGPAVVFIEVKTRTSVEKGMPSEAVDRRKREKYEKIAALFLRDYDVVDVPVRFDVVSLLVIDGDRAMVRHHINAFTAG